MIVNPNTPPTPDQETVIDSPLDMSHVVWGPAGTGKTYTAIKRVESILENDDSNQIVIFAAYNHPTLAYVKSNLEMLRVDASMVDINFSGTSDSSGAVIGLVSELKNAIESKRKKVVLFLTNTVLSNFIGYAPRPGQDTQLIKLKKQVDDDASASALIGNYKLHLFIDEAQVVSKVFLEELFDAFLPVEAVLVKSVSHVIEEVENGDITAEQGISEIESLVHVLEGNHEDHADDEHLDELLEELEKVIGRVEAGEIAAGDGIEEIETIIGAHRHWFQDFKMNLFLDQNQNFDGDEEWQNVGRHFGPRLGGSGCDQIFENRQPKYLRTKFVENVRNPEPINKLNNRYLMRIGQDSISALPLNPVPSDEPALYIREALKIQSWQEEYDQVAAMVANQCQRSPDQAFGVILVSNKKRFDTTGANIKNHELKDKFTAQLNAAFRAIGAPERACAYNFMDKSGWVMRINSAFDISSRVWVMDTLSIRGLEFAHVIIPDLDFDANDTQIEKRMYIAQSRTRGNLYVHTKKSTVDMFSSDDPRAPEAKIYSDLFEKI
jgi:hypothetical protein